MSVALNKAIGFVYEMGEGSPAVQQYHKRHGIEALLILTMFSASDARRAVRKIRRLVYGRTVVEIGAGVGLAAIELATIARRVYAIEADPAWSWVFTQELYNRKPPNLTWIFGAAESVADSLRADIAVIFTRSGFQSMARAAFKMAPIVYAANQGLFSRETSV